MPTSVYRVHHSLGFGGSASAAAVIRPKSGRFARICASRHKNGHQLNSVAAAWFSYEIIAAGGRQELLH